MSRQPLRVTSTLSLLATLAVDVPAVTVVLIATSICSRVLTVIGRVHCCNVGGTLVSGTPEAPSPRVV